MGEYVGFAPIQDRHHEDGSRFKHTTYELVHKKEDLLEDGVIILPEGSTEKELAVKLREMFDVGLRSYETRVFIEHTDGATVYDIPRVKPDEKSLRQAAQENKKVIVNRQHVSHYTDILLDKRFYLEAINTDKYPDTAWTECFLRFDENRPEKLAKKLENKKPPRKDTRVLYNKCVYPLAIIVDRIIREKTRLSVLSTSYSSKDIAIRFIDNAMKLIVTLGVSGRTIRRIAELNAYCYTIHLKKKQTFKEYLEGLKTLKPQTDKEKLFLSNARKLERICYGKSKKSNKKVSKKGSKKSNGSTGGRGRNNANSNRKR